MNLPVVNIDRQSAEPPSAAAGVARRSSHASATSSSLEKDRMSPPRWRRSARSSRRSTDFERDFPSLCFALATGVGKTRLMGASSAICYKAEGIRHFFVLAPNLTIYNKLIADFTPNTPKYVFQGIADFATNPPEIITGDNYEDGGRARRHGVPSTELFDRRARRPHQHLQHLARSTPKSAATSRPASSGCTSTSARATSSTCSKLDDLVLLMDESHRYRASAGVKAINELKPILGLELTATPQVESGSKACSAVQERHLQLSAVGGTEGRLRQRAGRRHPRELRRRQRIDQDGLERLKLEDGVRVHEESEGPAGRLRPG